MRCLQQATGWLDISFPEGQTMTTSSIKVAPPNSMFLISDAQRGFAADVSRSIPAIAATDTCIAVGSLAEMDGETKITIGPADEVDPGGHPTFDGALATPTRTVVVFTIEWKKLLEARVSSLQTRVRIWTNHPNEPDDVVIGLAS
jgi:hypothetical protein